MRTFLIAVTAFMAACEAPPKVTISTAPFEPDSGTIAIRCGTLIDGLSAKPQNDRVVVIRDGIISDIVDGDARLPTAVPLLDLADYTFLPGLIYTHTHIALYADDSARMTVYYRRSVEESTAIARENAKKTLLAGFTTVRNVGDYFPESVATHAKLPPIPKSKSWFAFHARSQAQSAPNSKTQSDGGLATEL